MATPFRIPGREPLFGARGWSAIAAFVASVTVLVPALFLAVP